MEYYHRMVSSPDFDDDFPQAVDYPNSEYIIKMQNILGSYPNIGVPLSMTGIAPFVYLGTTADAENVDRLKSMRVKYLLNCAGSGSAYQFRRYKNMYTPETGVMGYQELLIEDSEYSSIRPYLERAIAFIDYAVMRESKVLIYCPGASRSGAVALSYLVRRHTPLLMATRELKDKRRVVLTNDTFIKDVVAFARENHMLDAELDVVRAPRFGRKIDMHRLNRSHLPYYLQ